MVEQHSNAMQILKDAQQTQILAELPQWEDSQRTAFLTQIEQLNKVTPTGIVKYCERARKLLADSANNVNPYETFKPEVPAGIFLRPGSDAFDEMEEAGMAELAHVGFVLIAGGLGERLGFSGIKISLPVHTIEGAEYSYLRFYAEYALACKEAALKRDSALDKETFYVPFCIMTSNDTYARTIDLLESNDYFGLGKDRVDIVKQENVPALIDNSAAISFDEKTKVIGTKPHGHGDIHNLLFDSGVAAKWLAMGKKWMVFIQDTNALALKAIPSILGVSAKNDWQMNTVCVPRKPGEAMGAICKLVNEADPSDQLVINVEYNQLDSLLRQKWNKDGDVPNEEGYSQFPGNTNTLVFKIPEYLENLKKTGGVIPEFVNPKYADEQRTRFKAPTRLECMMQDYPKLLQGGKDCVGFTMYEAWYCFSPAKNNCADAVNCQKKGLPMFSPASAEFDMYNWNIKMMELAGAKITREQDAQEFAGVKQNFGPKIMLEPSFALTFKQIRDKIGEDTKISARSAVVLGGDAIPLKQTLIVDGTLIARKKINFFDHFEDEIVAFEPVCETDAEIYKIRGYKPKRVSAAQ